VYYTTGKDIPTPTDTDVQFYKRWPGRCPTVNISWFIAKAYLANLYYTTQRDVSLIIETCDDIIDVYQRSLMNGKFAEKAFPVVLSSQWSSIYDKELQELLGFYSLCSYVFDKSSSRSVYLGVCPVQFAMYVKVRTVKKALEICVRTCNDYSWDCNEHTEACQGNNKVNNGSLALAQADSIGFEKTLNKMILNLSNFKLSSNT